jgi:hypothetical protein
MSDLIETTDSLTARSWVGDSADDAFTQPYVDVDEWRETPVRHRYVHGGFHDADTAVLVLLPGAGRVRRAVLPARHTGPAARVPRAERGGPEQGDLRLLERRVLRRDQRRWPGRDRPDGRHRPEHRRVPCQRRGRSVLAGGRCRAVREHRPYGYLYGGSGGGYRTVGSSENTEGVWDGFNPHVLGSAMAMPNVFTVRMHAMRILRHKFPQIVDAHDVGGDPDSLDLTDEERGALTEVTRMGFPPRSWFGWKTMGMHAFSVLYPAIQMIDPTYFTDFWTLPGYLGTDPSSSIHGDRVQLTTTIAEILTEEPGDAVTGGVDESYKATARPGLVVGVKLPEVPSGWLLGADLTVHSGAAAGATLRVLEVVGDVVRLEPGQDPTVLDALAVGDEVTLDNSNFLAAQTYHRHQVPPVGLPGLGPVPPRRRHADLPAAGHDHRPDAHAGASGTLPAGTIHGKVILVSCLLDREAFAWQADWYRQLVVAHLGEQDRRVVPALVRRQRAPRRRGHPGVPDPDRRVPRRPRDRAAPTGGLGREGHRAVAEHGVRGRGRPDRRSGECRRARGSPADRHAHRERVPQRHGSRRRDGDRTSRGGSAGAGCRRGGRARPHRLGPARRHDPVGPGRSVVYETECSFAEPGVYMLGARIIAQAGGTPTEVHARVHNILRARVTVA